MSFKVVLRLTLNGRLGTCRDDKQKALTLIMMVPKPFKGHSVWDVGHSMKGQSGSVNAWMEEYETKYQARYGFKIDFENILDRDARVAKHVDACHNSTKSSILSADPA